MRNTDFVKFVKVFSCFTGARAAALTLPVLSAIIAPHDTQLIPLIRFISALGVDTVAFARRCMGWAWKACVPQRRGATSPNGVESTRLLYHTVRPQAW